MDHLNLRCPVGRDLGLSSPETKPELGISVVVLKASLPPCHWTLTELTLVYFIIWPNL